MKGDPGLRKGGYSCSGEPAFGSCTPEEEKGVEGQRGEGGRGRDEKGKEKRNRKKRTGKGRRREERKS